MPLGAVWLAMTALGLLLLALLVVVVKLCGRPFQHTGWGPPCRNDSLPPLRPLHRPTKRGAGDALRALPLLPLPWLREVAALRRWRLGYARFVGLIYLACSLYLLASMVWAWSQKDPLLPGTAWVLGSAALSLLPILFLDLRLGFCESAHDCATGSSEGGRCTRGRVA